MRRLGSGRGAIGGDATECEMLSLFAKLCWKGQARIRPRDSVSSVERGVGLDDLEQKENLGVESGTCLGKALVKPRERRTAV